MFGTEIKLPTFVFICIETLIFIFHLANYIARPHDRSRKRFLWLILCFIIYNVCSGLLPDKNIPLHPLLQNILSLGAGIVLASYYFYYLVAELQIVQDRVYRPKVLFTSLIGCLILCFVCAYLLTGDIGIARQVFILPPIAISLYFCFLTVRFLKNHANNPDQRPYNLMVYSGYIGVVFMASMPVVVAFGDYQILNNSLVNVSFALACYAYMNLHLHQTKAENRILRKADLSNARQNELQVTLAAFHLTTAEIDVALLVVQDKTYPEIADLLYIATGTASKHASNIFKKTQTANKKEFIDKFKASSVSLPETNNDELESPVLL